jgi:hypothetical protein
MPQEIDLQKLQLDAFQKRSMDCLNEAMKVLSERKAKAKLDPDPDLISEEAVVQAIVSSALMVLSTMRFSEEEATMLQHMGVELAEQVIAMTEQHTVQSKIAT